MINSAPPSNTQTPPDQPENGTVYVQQDPVSQENTEQIDPP